ncbi:hypothetical protein F5148DRAFT_1206186 [Russula earlei]|uniref:Uncharacterized protein n=1 Tax=Russula earlei TaxID=71964 RepID=A0ACC0U6S8_9AGAM|nr:hypothetical protein F5148DRAFT_1206186 [Russula earlei]
MPRPWRLALLLPSRFLQGFLGARTSSSSLVPSSLLYVVELIQGRIRPTSGTNGYARHLGCPRTIRIPPPITEGQSIEITSTVLIMASCPRRHFSTGRLGVLSTSPGRSQTRRDPKRRDRGRRQKGHQ